VRRTHERCEAVEAYAAAYRRYCWPVQSVEDLRLAPFHILATEGSVHVDKSHSWHMDEIARLAEAGAPWLQPTVHRSVELEDATSVAAAVDWWTALTAGGEEGMVVKPEAFVSRGARGLTQPALKVRGYEYLRIIYGPEYTLPDHLEQLRGRGLSRKRSLALKEFALGIEALRRFVSGTPLRKVHECVFGILALESEPIDPRL
jgi:protein phosphatase